PYKDSRPWAVERRPMTSRSRENLGRNRVAPSVVRTDLCSQSGVPFVKVSRSTANAIEALTYLATQDADKNLASHTIDRARGISEKSLLKALLPLVKAGILLSLRGPNGGYRLCRPAREITLLEVFEAVDGPIKGQVEFVSNRPALNQKLRGVCDD